MKQLLVFISALLIGLLGVISSSFSQEIQWSNHAGGPGSEYGGSSVIDHEGNTYYSGIFCGNECYFQTDTLYQFGTNGIYLVKYDALGNEIWAKRIGGNTSEDVGQGFSDMVYDSTSNMIFCVGTISTTYNGVQNILTKLDTDGKIVWMKTYSGVSLFSGFSALTLNENKEIFITGSISTTVNFDTIQVLRGGFIAKFDSSGNCLWAKKKFGYDQISVSEVQTSGIKVVNDKIFVSAYLACDRTIFIDTIKIDHKGYGSSMIMCFDKECNIQWITEGISKMTYSYSDLAVDNASNLYYTGCFRDTISFSGNLLITWPGMKDFFLIKLDKDGMVQWLNQTRASIAEGVDIISDEGGNTYVTGYFKGHGTFGDYEITAQSNEDIFLARYNTSGECKGVINYPNGEGNGLSQDSDGNPSFIFIFEGTTTVGRNTYESYGATDFIFAKCSAITGLEEHQKNEQNTLLIYANPNTGKCNIIIPDEFKNDKNLRLQIFDNKGRLIQQTAVEIVEDKIKLNIEAQARGMYTAILSNGKKNYSGKIVFE